MLKRILLGLCVGLGVVVGASAGDLSLSYTRAALTGDDAVGKGDSDLLLNDHGNAFKLTYTLDELKLPEGKLAKANEYITLKPLVGISWVEFGGRDLQFGGLTFRVDELESHAIFAGVRVEADEAFAAEKLKGVEPFVELDAGFAIKDDIAFGTAPAAFGGQIYDGGVDRYIGLSLGAQYRIPKTDAKFSLAYNWTTHGKMEANPAVPPLRDFSFRHSGVEVSVAYNF